MKTQNTQNKVKNLLTLPLIALTLVSSSAIADTNQIGNGDFNGDGYDDMLVGMPWEDVGSIRNAGAVSVFYGTRTGLFHEPRNQLHQDTPRLSGRAAILDKAEINDNFGEVIAVGDFNNDGYDDAAISATTENAQNGVVHILYGSSKGVWGERNSLLSVEKAGFGGIRTLFGSSLAVGDIDGDGYSDLAVGAPFYRINNNDFAGAVFLFYGGADGLKEDGSQGQLFYEGRGNIPGVAEKYNRFGEQLTMDDFDQDGYADLAIAAPRQTIGSVSYAGEVTILYGKSYRNYQFRAGTMYDPAQIESGDMFGTSLATGDFDGNGYPDLAVGKPLENSNAGIYDTGAVSVIFSSSRGLNIANYQTLTQGNGVDNPERSDRFGTTMTAGDFNGDGIDDLSIGTPNETHERRFRTDYRDSGQVSVFYGNSTGLKVTNRSNWHQDITGVDFKRYKYNRFGDTLAAGDYNNDGLTDLVVGVPGEDLYFNYVKQVNAGSIHIFYGQNAGLSTYSGLGRELYYEPLRTNAAGRPEAYDYFGGDIN